MIPVYGTVAALSFFLEMGVPLKVRNGNIYGIS